MIRNIEILKCFGIFQNFTAPATLHKFEKFNLFYGWNGCGKSTLSKLFASIEYKKLDTDFKDCEFKLVADTETITHQNIQNNNLNLRVFNQDFIKNNIEWDTKINSILVIAEDRIEDRNKFEKLKKEIKNLLSKSSELIQDQEHLQHTINRFYSSSAATIKESFKIIDTQDKHYFNYDKRKFEAFLQANNAKILIKTSILSEEQKENIVKSIQPVQKDEIIFEYAALNSELFTEAREKINDIIQQCITATVIEKLKENPSLNSWVKDGIELHETLGSADCEFCGQELPPSRMQDLNNHFNDQYKQVMEKINTAIQWCQQLVEKSIAYPDTISLYPELQETYLAIKADMENKKSAFDNCIGVWEALLIQKKSNPFQQLFLPADELGLLISNFNTCLNALKNIIINHNEKTKNFAEDLKKNKSALELHYAAQIVQGSDLADWLTNLKKIQKEISTIKPELTNKNTEASRLEASIIDEAKGADEFNHLLHKFLGRRDISLKFNKEAKGYNIIRANGSVARNLSEGEKTAIAFVYFVIKLRERDNKIENTIIVVDDPISSFDSNHLFHAYAFLKNSCEKSAQLFVFTHNFQYFRLIRDWFDKKNKEVWENGKKVEKIRARFFAIESNMEEDRSSIIRNAHESLQKYNSEYHYVFQRLHSSRTEVIDSLDKAYLIGNLCRKLLEGFLTFKYPKARNDFRSLMNDCCTDNELLERIYRFINKYSHNQLIEFHDTPVENLMSEGNSIITDVLTLMRTLDEKHVQEMESICNN